MFVVWTYNLKSIQLPVIEKIDQYLLVNVVPSSSWQHTRLVVEYACMSTSTMTEKCTQLREWVLQLYSCSWVHDYETWVWVHEYEYRKCELKYQYENEYSNSIVVVEYMSMSHEYEYMSMSTWVWVQKKWTQVSIREWVLQLYSCSWVHDYESWVWVHEYEYRKMNSSISTRMSTPTLYHICCTLMT